MTLRSGLRRCDLGRCNLVARRGGHDGRDAREAAMTGKPVIDKFLHAIETADIPGCDVWSEDALCPSEDVASRAGGGDSQ